MYYIFIKYVLFFNHILMVALALGDSVSIHNDDTVNKVEEVFEKVLGYKVRLDDILSHPVGIEEKKLAILWHRYSIRMALARIRSRHSIR